METFWEKALNWLKRNSIWFVIGLLALYVLGFKQELIDTIFTILILWSLAIFLCGLTLYCLTKLDFISIGKTNDRSLIGWITLGCFIFLGLCVYSIYMVEGIKMSVLP